MHEYETVMAQAEQISELKQQREALLIDLAASLEREDALKQQRDELQRDAKRYRWLNRYAVGLRQWDYYVKHIKELDAAIDATIAKEQ